MICVPYRPLKTRLCCSVFKFLSIRYIQNLRKRGQGGPSEWDAREECQEDTRSAPGEGFKIKKSSKPPPAIEAAPFSPLLWRYKRGNGLSDRFPGPSKKKLMKNNRHFGVPNPGIDALSFGVDTLRSGVDALNSGIGALNLDFGALNFDIGVPNSGFDAFRSGVDAFRLGVDALRSGVDAFRLGVDTLRSGVDALYMSG